MKSLSVLLTAFCTLLTIHIEAQFNVGIKSGFGASNITFTGIQPSIIPKTKSQASFDLGLFTEIPINSSVYFQPELYYARRGFKVEEQFNFEVISLPLSAGGGIYTTINYIQMPLIMKYKFGNDRIKGLVGAGPNVSYAANGRINTKANFIIDINVSETPLDLRSDSFTRTSLAGDLLAGVEVPVASGALIVEGRYSHNLTETLEVPIINIGVRSSNLGLMVGYRFDF